MRECKWCKDEDCYIDYPDAVFPCIVKGNLDDCFITALDGKPLKDTNYCTKEDIIDG